MARNWIDTRSDEEARVRAEEFWVGMSADLDGGEFWADRIKGYRDAPAKRFALAMEHLPLPGAFGEAAIAVRAQIRARRKAGEAFEEELTQLYELAVLRSFMLDYAPRLQEPGFNVVESIPGQRLRSLRYEYSQLGYGDLSLLNKTDIKWLIAAWGEPASHSTLHALHREVWDEYETKLIEQRMSAGQDLRDELRSLLSEDRNPRPGRQPEAARRGCSLMIAALATGAFGGSWWFGG